MCLILSRGFIIITIISIIIISSLLDSRVECHTDLVVKDPRLKHLLMKITDVLRVEKNPNTFMVLRGHTFIHVFKAVCSAFSNVKVIN